MIKQNRLKSMTAFVLVLFMVITLVTIPVSAQTVSSSGFTVRAIIPDNQIDKSRTYFDLLMQPGQTQTLYVDVTNSNNEEITIDVALHAASTNRNGLIEYQVKVDPDETLKVPFNTISQADNVVKVAPKSTQRVEITIAMPEDEFDGAVLGGIIFTKRLDNNAMSGVSINNQFSYVIGVKLSENEKEVQPDFRIKSIEPTLVNYRKAISVNIHNPVPLIIKNANISASIYRENETVPLFSINKNGVDMAPNSVMPLPVEWEGKTMEAGKYRLTLKLSHNGKIFEWDQSFTLNSDQVRDVNDNALDEPLKDNWWIDYWWLPVMILLILLLIWFAFLLGRRRRDDEKRRT